MTSTLFLSAEDVQILTGFTIRVKQIEQLKRMGIPFFVNGCGKPIVAIAVVEGRKQESKPKVWKPAMLQPSKKAA